MLLLLLIFLVPIALYCLALAGINRSSRPVLASGIADLIGLLFALSGFLFVVGPQILKALFERTLNSIPLDENSKAFDQSVAMVGALWIVFWVAYFVIVLIGIGIAFWLQRNKTVIYNIDLPTFEDAFSKTLDQLGLVAQRRGSTILLTTFDYATSAGDTHVTRVASAPVARGEAALQFEYFPALCHLTLRWTSSAGQLREAVEAELAEVLEHANADSNNPASMWFLGVGGSLIGMIIVILLLLLLVVILPHLVR